MDVLIKLFSPLFTPLFDLLNKIVAGYFDSKGINDKGKWENEIANTKGKWEFETAKYLSTLTSSDKDERHDEVYSMYKKSGMTLEEFKKKIEPIAFGSFKNYPQYTQETGVVGVGVVSSIREGIIAENPALKNRTLALVALKVSAGDVIDSIIPIFNEITPDLKVKDKSIEGEKVGGNGGGAILLEQKGYIITGIDVYRGNYFGRVEVIQIQVIWHKLTTQGIDLNTENISEKLGTGNYADTSQPPKKFRTISGNYFSDFRDISFSYHTDGKTFLHDFDMVEDKLPTVN
jgi:hypothetical protein